MNLDIPKLIKSKALDLLPELLDVRRHIHKNPELSFEEFETQKFVEAKLRSYGITHITPMAGTGLVALIEGEQTGGDKTVALRADLDALPIQEKNQQPYASVKQNIMHACGHDVHTACLLGAANILQSTRNLWSGTVKLIFQPGEEKMPGGASVMINEGVLTNPTPTCILGQHVMPKIQVGKVGFKSGMYMASADEIYITVSGKGGHGAMPELNIDPVLISAHLIVALQQIVSRRANPRTPSVLSFGRVEALGATNVIPESVYIEGTFRTLDENWRAEAKTIIKKLATELVESMGGKCNIEVADGYPYLQNNEPLTAKCIEWAGQYLGPENVEPLDLWMAAEDFAFYSHQLPGCFYRLGTGNSEKGIVSSVHTPTFDIDEDALTIGAGLMAYLTIAELSDKS